MSVSIPHFLHAKNFSGVAASPWSRWLQALVATPGARARSGARDRREPVATIDPSAATEHVLKIWPVSFAAILDGSKPYEVRDSKHGFRVGERLLFKEWDPVQKGYTGRSLGVVISHVTPGGAWGLPDNLCVLGLGAPATLALHECRAALAELLSLQASAGAVDGGASLLRQQAVCEHARGVLAACGVIVPRPQ